MIRKLKLSITPAEASDDVAIVALAREELNLKNDDNLKLELIKKSIDSRQKKILVNLSFHAFINEQRPEKVFPFKYFNVVKAPVVYIAGSGPAGLFAALRCLELKLKPIIFERGKELSRRRRDIAILNRNHTVNPDSNYCFGEGGAGTFSDGKLFTRTKNKNEVENILQILVAHGANPSILTDAHPHVGTNLLPRIIEAIKNTILSYGGEIHFDSKLVDICVENQQVYAIKIKNLHKNKVEEYPCKKLILATGHSARDIFFLLDKRKILIESKSFAMGIRIEHPQELIDRIQYHCASPEEVLNVRKFLPPSEYSMVHTEDGKSVYSFCMCPGGIIAPCATAPEEIVTNGWSPSKRNNPFANSGIVVNMEPEDWRHFLSYSSALGALNLQVDLEKKAWAAGGGGQTAPAQRMMDFLKGKSSGSLPACSYTPGIRSYDLPELLGEKMTQLLRMGLKNFGISKPGYITNEAVLVGVESRTSSPIRIPRDKSNGQHIHIKGLFPCGEGAGYAGGIVSAAIDGQKSASFALR